MHLWVKILVSLIGGWLLAGSLLLLAFYLDDPYWSPVLLWHSEPFSRLAGNGPLLGYDAAGKALYEGTPVHLLFGIIGAFIGFVVYPVLTFLVLVVVDNIRPKNY